MWIAHKRPGDCEPERFLPYFCWRLRGTVLTDAEPPVWAQSGFRSTGAPWPVPWAFGTQNAAVAFVFSKVLVAGSGPRVDGTYNKVRFVANADYPNGYMNVAIEARPLG